MLELYTRTSVCLRFP